MYTLWPNFSSVSLVLGRALGGIGGRKPSQVRDSEGSRSWMRGVRRIVVLGVRQGVQGSP